MKIRHIIVILALTILKIEAQNPISPVGVYIADPSAHRWKDGKIYIYGSNDENPDYFCSSRHHVISSSDLLNWTLYKNSFASKDSNDQVAYSDDILYAPDCQFKDNTYFLYYCLASNKNVEGVATSKSPTGPFVNGKNIKVGKYNEIDPCVFIDDDGQTYYIWGQFTAKIAKMKPNMIEIDTTTIKDGIITEREHFFHEGSYMVKRNGIYYFIYAHMGRAGKPTCLGYATAKSPYGPFKYGGVIIDNDHSDPGCWNNHGSLAEFNGKWYVFYHRSSHGTNTMRKACVEPIQFNADGSITEVEMTTQGAGPSLAANQSLEAERACLLYGNIRSKKISSFNEALTEIKNGDVAAYKYLNFDVKVDSFKVDAIPDEKPVSIQIVADSPWGQTIGQVNMPGKGDGKTMKTYSCKVNQLKGVHSLWIRFLTEGTNPIKIDKFRFE